MTETSTLISETRQRARKKYVCDDCGWLILKGELYARACLVYDGLKFTWRRCESCDQWCNSPMAHLCSHIWEEGGWGEVADWLAWRFEHGDGWIYVDDAQRREYGLGEVR